MGTFTQKLTIRSAGSNGSAGKAVTVDALIDTGAMFSSVPAQVLEGLGVKPFRTMPVKFANGQTAQIPMGEVQAELDGQSMPILVLFGAEGVPPLLGAHALEAFLLMVDPISKKLIRHEAFLMMADETTGVVPSAPYKAIGHGRMMQLDALGVPAVLVFVGRETSEQASPIVTAVREVYPTVGQVMICNMADVRGIPKLVRKPVEMLMKSSYKDAVDNLEAGRTAEDYVLILPDWDAAAYDAFGVKDVSKLAAVGVIDRAGKIVGMYQGDNPAVQVLAFLQIAGA